MNSLLRVDRAQWGYRSRGGLLAPAREISFEVPPAAIVMLTGANGAGKTTILRGLLGLAERVAGHVAWAVPRSSVGYVPQESAIERSIPAAVMDIVRTGNPASWGRNRRSAHGCLEQVGMAEMGSHRFSSLSGGQRQRTLVARALMGRPRLLFLDEPTVSVDARTAERIGQVIRELADRHGLGILVTSHVANWVEATTEIRVLPEVPQ